MAVSGGLRAQLLKYRGRTRFNDSGNANHNDFDMSYITKSIIAMGFPAAKGTNTAIMNPREKVADFLERRHKNHYKVINLCSEKQYQYDDSEFNGNVLRFPHPPESPCPLLLLADFCLESEAYLKLKKGNVLVVHCDNGKGRTGFMISCLLLHLGIDRTSKQAISHFTSKRCFEITVLNQPSQRRYIEYWEAITRAGRLILKSPLGVTLRSTLLQNYTLYHVTVTSRPFGMSLAPSSVRVDKVEGHAQAAGIKKGDLLVAIGSMNITASTWLDIYEYAKPPFKISLRRKRKRRNHQNRMENHTLPHPNNNGVHKDSLRGQNRPKPKPVRAGSVLVRSASKDPAEKSGPFSWLTNGRPKTPPAREKSSKQSTSMLDIKSYFNSAMKNKKKANTEQVGIPKDSKLSVREAEKEWNEFELTEELLFGFKEAKIEHDKAFPQSIRESLLSVVYLQIPEPEVPALQPQISEKISSRRRSIVSAEDEWALTYAALEELNGLSSFNPGANDSLHQIAPGANTSPWSFDFGPSMQNAKVTFDTSDFDGFDAESDTDSLGFDHGDLDNLDDLDLGDEDDGVNNDSENHTRESKVSQDDSTNGIDLPIPIDGNDLDKSNTVQGNVSRALHKLNNSSLRQATLSDSTFAGLATNMLLHDLKPSNESLRKGNNVSAQDSQTPSFGSTQMTGTFHETSFLEKTQQFKVPLNKNIGSIEEVTEEPNSSTIGDMKKITTMMKTESDSHNQSKKPENAKRTTSKDKLARSIRSSSIWLPDERIGGLKLTSIMLQNVKKGFSTITIHLFVGCVQILSRKAVVSERGNFVVPVGVHVTGDVAIVGSVAAPKKVSPSAPISLSSTAPSRSLSSLISGSAGSATSPTSRKRMPLFRFWFHSALVDRMKLVLRGDEVDLGVDSTTGLGQRQRFAKGARQVFTSKTRMTLSFSLTNSGATRMRQNKGSTHSGVMARVFRRDVKMKLYARVDIKLRANAIKRKMNIHVGGYVNANTSGGDLDGGVLGVRIRSHGERKGGILGSYSKQHPGVSEDEKNDRKPHHFITKVTAEAETIIPVPFTSPFSNRNGIDRKGSAIVKSSSKVVKLGSPDSETLLNRDVALKRPSYWILRSRNKLKKKGSGGSVHKGSKKGFGYKRGSTSSLSNKGSSKKYSNAMYTILVVTERRVWRVRKSLNAFVELYTRLIRTYPEHFEKEIPNKERKIPSEHGDPKPSFIRTLLTLGIQRANSENSTKQRLKTLTEFLTKVVVSLKLKEGIAFLRDPQVSSHLKNKSSSQSGDIKKDQKHENSESHQPEKSNNLRRHSEMKFSEKVRRRASVLGEIELSGSKCRYRSCTNPCKVFLNYCTVHFEELYGVDPEWMSESWERDDPSLMASLRGSHFKTNNHMQELMSIQIGIMDMSENVHGASGVCQYLLRCLVSKREYKNWSQHLQMAVDWDSKVPLLQLMLQCIRMRARHQHPCGCSKSGVICKNFKLKLALVSRMMHVFDNCLSSKVDYSRCLALRMHWALLKGASRLPTCRRFRSLNLKNYIASFGYRTLEMAAQSPSTKQFVESMFECILESNPGSQTSVLTSPGFIPLLLRSVRGGPVTLQKTVISRLLNSVMEDHDPNTNLNSPRIFGISLAGLENAFRLSRISGFSYHLAALAKTLFPQNGTSFHKIPKDIKEAVGSLRKLIAGILTAGFGRFRLRNFVGEIWLWISAHCGWGKRIRLFVKTVVTKYLENCLSLLSGSSPFHTAFTAGSPIKNKVYQGSPPIKYASPTSSLALKNVRLSTPVEKKGGKSLSARSSSISSSAPKKAALPLGFSKPFPKIDVQQNLTLIKSGKDGELVRREESILEAVAIAFDLILFRGADSSNDDILLSPSYANLSLSRNRDESKSSGPGHRSPRRRSKKKAGAQQRGRSRTKKASPSISQQSDASSYSDSKGLPLLDSLAHTADLSSALPIGRRLASKTKRKAVSATRNSSKSCYDADPDDVMAQRESADAVLSQPKHTRSLSDTHDHREKVEGGSIYGRKASIGLGVPSDDESGIVAAHSGFTDSVIHLFKREACVDPGAIAPDSRLLGLVKDLINRGIEELEETRETKDAKYDDETRKQREKMSSLFKNIIQLANELQQLSKKVDHRGYQKAVQKIIRRSKARGTLRGLEVILKLGPYTEDISIIQGIVERIKTFKKSSLHCQTDRYFIRITRDFVLEVNRGVASSKIRTEIRKCHVDIFDPISPFANAPPQVSSTVMSKLRDGIINPEGRRVYGFKVTTDTEVFVFAVTSKRERDLWIKELELAMEFSRTQGILMFYGPNAPTRCNDTTITSTSLKKRSGTVSDPLRTSEMLSLLDPRKGFPYPLVEKCQECRSSFTLFSTRIQCEHCGREFCRKCCQDRYESLREELEQSRKVVDSMAASELESECDSACGESPIRILSSEQSASSTKDQQEKLNICTECLLKIQDRIASNCKEFASLMAVAPGEDSQDEDEERPIVKRTKSNTTVSASNTLLRSEMNSLEAEAIKEGKESVNICGDSDHKSDIVKYEHA